MAPTDPITKFRLLHQELPFSVDWCKLRLSGLPGASHPPMANWIIHRPHAHCHAAEIRVAEYLRDLDHRWTVIWGYYYRDDQGNDREGDFLVLGPAGGLLVLEVKSSIPRWFHSTGQWEGERVWQVARSAQRAKWW
jgi:hypothetical protein